MDILTLTFNGHTKNNKQISKFNYCDYWVSTNYGTIGHRPSFGRGGPKTNDGFEEKKS